MVSDYRRLPAENADRFEGLGLYLVDQIEATKRVAAAVGDGALVVRSIHASLVAA